MNSRTFHKTPLSFWFLLAVAILIAELCIIYLALETQTSTYNKTYSAATGAVLTSQQP